MPDSGEKWDRITKGFWLEPTTPPAPTNTRYLNDSSVTEIVVTTDQHKPSFGGLFSN